MKTSKVALGLVLIAVTASAWAATYTELVPWTKVQGGTTSTSHFAAAVDGQTSFHQLLTGAGITRVDSLNGTQTSTVLLTSAQWATASGGASSMATYYGFGVSGNYVQFTDTSSDQVYRLDKNTPGAISTYATKADIMAATGQADDQLVSPADTNPLTGEMTFYDSVSKGILRTNGPHNVQYLLTGLQLTNAMGNNVVGGGLAWDSAGDLYFGSSTSKDLWRLNADLTIVPVLSQAQVLAVTGGTSLSWKDILVAPDGWVYFGENTSAHILRFNPADPAGSLQIFLSKTDLLAGPMASANMVSLGWYDPDGAGPNPGGLTFHTFGTKGLYYFPEPASALLLTLGLLVIRRR
jgi:hypothetical protein